MKRCFFLLIFLCSVLLKIFSQDSFSTSIINNSYYSVEIDGIIIESGKKVKHSFPLHNAQLYDSWTLTYKIPLTNTVSYEYKSKLHIVDNQQNVVIDNPLISNNSDSYIIIKNDSKKSIQLTNGISTYYKSYTEGIINGKNIVGEMYITPGQTIVYPYTDANKLFIQSDITEVRVCEKDEIRKNSIYKYRFTDNGIERLDARPLLKIGENTWEIPFDNNTQITNLVGDNKSIFFLGTEKDRAFINSLDNKININQFDIEEPSSNSFSSIRKFSENLIVAGKNNTSKTPFIVRYSTTGERIGQEVDFENYSEIKPFVYGNDLYIAGLTVDGKNIAIVPIKNAKKLSISKSIAELSVDDNIISFMTASGEHISNIFCAINYENYFSNIYRININTGDFSRLEISENFIDISNILIDEFSNVYFVGTKDNYRTSIIKLLESNGYAEELVYSFTEKNVSINDSFVKDGNELILCGTVKSSVEIKSAFCMGINLNSSEILWRNQSFNFRNGELTKIIPYADYGYIATYTSLDNCGLIRLNSAGSIDNNHQCLESSISIKSDIAGFLYINGIKNRMLSEEEIISFSLIPQNYYIELKDAQDNLIDYKEIILKKNEKQKIDLVDNGKLFLQKTKSNISYRVINNGKGIEILGNGEIQEAIWLSEIQVNDVESIIIDEGITSIGNSVFYKYKNLSYLRLPNSLTSIGKRAFSSCDNLTTVILPSELQSLADEAFYGCAFSSINLPASFNKIGSLVFSHNYNLKKITVNENNVHYKDVNGILYTKDESELIIYPPMKEDKKFIVSEKVQIIHENAFYYQNYVQEITVGANVRNIGKNAFVHCSALQNFYVMPDNKWFKSFDGILFNYSGSRLIAYPYGKPGKSKYTISKSIETIEDNALNVKALDTIIFESQTVPKIGQHDWEKRNSFRIVVPSKSYEVYINTKAFESVQAAIITNWQYQALVESDIERDKKAKRKESIVDFFTPYDDWFAMEFGGYYGLSKFNACRKIEYPNINFPDDCEWDQPRFGIKADLLYEGTGFECAFPYIEYSFTKTKLSYDNLTYNQLDVVGLMLGPNIKRRIALKTGIAFTMLWESRESDNELYSDGTSLKIGFSIPVDLTIRITKFLSFYGEYKWSIFPNQAFERRTYNTGIMINTTF